MTILDVAVPCPLRRSFDYRAPEGAERIEPGMRVLVPFGPRRLVAVVLALKATTEVPENKLKSAIRMLDTAPSLSAPLLALGQWAANYYHHPIGECLNQMLPVRLRREKPPRESGSVGYRLTDAGRAADADELRPARRQAALLAYLQENGGTTRRALREAGFSDAVIKGLRERGLLARENLALNGNIEPAAGETAAPALTLNEEQQRAVDIVAAHLGGFQPALLQGVTGSGKTEVYLQLIQRCLDRGQQALVLIPEIGLTPQTLRRFGRRFPGTISVLHSGLADGERLGDWQRAGTGENRVIIGTRSAVFTPFQNLGLIIIDEEHDASYKQQDGFRYSARDIAVKRAADNQCPIVLGSATPSLETLHNVRGGKYLMLELNERAGGAKPPAIKLQDIRDSELTDGLSAASLSAIGDTLDRGEQALVFLNRRGFAPTLQCHCCGWLARCDHCDVSLTVHFGKRQLRCHHCEAQKRLPETCPACENHTLEFRGPGTERLEHALNSAFPDTSVLRIDRDTTAGKTAMDTLVGRVNQGDPCVLVGTQMLAKGHHFPGVTLVVIVDIDGGLFSADFRGAERSGQLLVQVAGRAGRADKPGTVLVQTHAPEHPVLTTLIKYGYGAFAETLLQERRHLGLPPYGYLAVIRADAPALATADEFLQQLREGIGLPGNHAQIMGPLPAPITRKAGRYRSSLILNAERRGQLHALVQKACAAGDTLKTRRGVRWSVDVDPLEWF